MDQTGKHTGYKRQFVKIQLIFQIQVLKRIAELNTYYPLSNKLYKQKNENTHTSLVITREMSRLKFVKQEKKHPTRIISGSLHSAYNVKVDGCYDLCTI